MNTYITVKELQEITGLSYLSALEIIKEVRKEMKEKGYLIPRGKELRAIKSLTLKRLGLG